LRYCKPGHLFLILIGQYNNRIIILISANRGQIYGQGQYESPDYGSCRNRKCQEQHLSFIHLSTISTSPRYLQIHQLCYLFYRFVSNTLPSPTRHGDSAQLRMLLCLQGISDSVASHLLSCSSPSSSPPRETCEPIALLENNSKELYNRLINCPIGFQTNMTNKTAVDIYQSRYQKGSPYLCTVRHLQSNIQRTIASVETSASGNSRVASWSLVPELRPFP
jgi:hypothetical protein